MNVLKKRNRSLLGIVSEHMWRFVLLCFSLSCGLASAQENSIQSISANQQGSNVIVKITLRNPLVKAPIGFSISNPARIALDFAGTANGTGKTTQDINLGDVRSANVVQAGERSRLIFNLQRSLNYATVVEGNAVIVTIDGSGEPAVALSSAGIPAGPKAVIPGGGPAIRDIDFRRGTAGEGRVVIDLPNNQVGVDVRQQGQTVVVDFLKTSLPEVLRRKLDVADFGTPVSTISTIAQGENVRMIIEPKGLWEHSAYQSDTQLVVEVKPIKEDPNKLTQGTQGYRGEKLSLNFQNVEVRAVLQVIADFTGLNIITSDTVNGNLTLRLKDVPWDQALDIVMQAKGLDMRKNGQVLWIAPKDELLTKEKLELEQRSHISELEPLKTETFQLNYQKAEAFKTLLGTAGSTTAGNSILSKRGSAVIDPRTNQLFVTDIASKMEDIRQLVKKTDIPSRQVLIEARIVEADDTFSKSLGAKLGFADLRAVRGGDGGYQIAGNTRATVTGSLEGALGQSGQTSFLNSGATQFVNLPASAINGFNPGSLGVSIFSAAANRFLNLELSALEADGKGKIVSSPRVVTADQLAAVIEQGEEIPCSITTYANGVATTTITYKKAVLKLDVTPQITPDGGVILNVDVAKDSRGEAAGGCFAINTKHVKTNVLVENGGTVVLGGIFTQEEKDSVAKVPMLGDIPIVGNLFKTNNRVANKTELLIFITPKIVTDKLSTR